MSRLNSRLSFVATYLVATCLLEIVDKMPKAKRTYSDFFLPAFQEKPHNILFTKIAKKNIFKREKKEEKKTVIFKSAVKHSY